MAAIQKLARNIPWGVDNARSSARVRALTNLTLEETMPAAANLSDRPAAIRVDLGAIFVSMELSSIEVADHILVAERRGEDVEARGRWRRPGGAIESVCRAAGEDAGEDGPQLSDHRHPGGGSHWVLDPPRLGEGRDRKPLVDLASITTSRRKKRAKTDRIDGEALVRALLAYKRGEPRVCSMVRPPSPEEEDRRRLVRERKALITERIRHSNRIKGLLFAQGISKYEPLRRDRRARLAALRTGDGRELPAHLKAQISRELGRLELLLEQLKAVEAERDALLARAGPCQGASWHAPKAEGHRPRVRRHPLVGGPVPPLR